MPIWVLKIAKQLLNFLFVFSGNRLEKGKYRAIKMSERTITWRWRYKFIIDVVSALYSLTPTQPYLYSRYLLFPKLSSNFPKVPFPKPANIQQSFLRLLISLQSSTENCLFFGLPSTDLHTKQLLINKNACIVPSCLFYFIKHSSSYLLSSSFYSWLLWRVTYWKKCKTVFFIRTIVFTFRLPWQPRWFPWPRSDDRYRHVNNRESNGLNWLRIGRSRQDVAEDNDSQGFYR